MSTTYNNIIVIMSVFITTCAIPAACTDVSTNYSQTFTINLLTPDAWNPATAGLSHVVSTAIGGNFGIDVLTQEAWDYTTTNSSHGVSTDTSGNFIGDFMDVLYTTGGEQQALSGPFRLDTTQGASLGRVVDAQSNAAIAGATITGNGTVLNADGNGQFVISSFVGTSISVSAQCYINTNVWVPVTAGKALMVIPLYKQSDSTKPKILAVTGTQFNASNRAVFFSGVSKSVDINVVVDWGRTKPSSVVLSANGFSQTIRTTDGSVKTTMDIGQIASVGTMKVKAIAEDGTPSDEAIANFVVAPQPKVFGQAVSWKAEHDGYMSPWSNTFIGKTSKDSDSGQDKASSFKVPDDKPLFGGKEFKASLKADIFPKAGYSGEVDALSIGLNESKEYKSGARRTSSKFGRFLGIDADAGLSATYKEKWLDDGSFWAPRGELNLFINIARVYSIPVPGFTVMNRSFAGFDVEASFGIRGELIGGVLLDTNKDFQFDASGKIIGYGQISAEISASKLLTLSAYGKAEAEANMDFYPQIAWGGFKFTVSAEAKAKVGTWEAGKSWSYELYNSTMQQPPIINLSSLVPPVEGWQQISRRYGDQSGLVMRMQTPHNSSAQLSTLQYGVFPYCKASAIPLSDGVLALNITDNASRSSVNRMMLVARKWSNGTWGSDFPVADNGTQDTAPALSASPDGTMACAFMDTETSLSENSTMEQMLAQQRIAVSRYNPAQNSFEAPFIVSGSGSLNRDPAISVKNADNIVVAWVNNSANRFQGSVESPDVLQAAIRSPGGWSAPVSIPSSLSFIGSVATGYSGNRPVVVFSAKSSNDVEVRTDYELYQSTWGGSNWSSPQRLTSNSVIDDQPRLVTDNSGVTSLVWSQADKIVAAPLSSLGSTVVLADSGLTGQTETQLAQGPNGMWACVWNGSTGSEQHLFASTYDGTVKAWSAPQTMTAGYTRDRGSAAAFAPDGKLVMLYTKSALEDQVEDVIIDGSIKQMTKQVETQTDLIGMSYTLLGDIAVDSVSCIPENPEGGTTADVLVVLKNLGELPVSGFNVVLLDNGTAINDVKRVEQPILGGQSVQLVFRWNVPINGGTRTLTAVADPEGVLSDRNRTNNVLGTKAVWPDLCLSDLSAESAGLVRYVRATIANQGGTIASNVKVNIFRDSSLFKTVTIESIPAGSTYDILESYELPVSGLVGSQIKVVLDPDKAIEESNEYNNEGSLSVTGNQPKRSVTIKCSLADFTGLPSSVSVDVDWAAAGSDRSSFSAVPDGTGLVGFEIDPSKSGVLLVKPNHWLSRSFAIGSGSDTINLGTVGFTNGDADGDNYINLFDFVILDRKFGSSDMMGDLDGSGSVNLFDYVIIDQNFGRQGE